MRGTQDSERWLAAAVVNMALIYRAQGKYDEALKKSQEGLEIFERLKDTRLIAATYFRFGTIYYQQGNYKRALEYFGRASEIWKGLPREKRDYAATLLHIADVYLDQGNYPQALDFAEQAANILEQIGHFGEHLVWFGWRWVRHI